MAVGCRHRLVWLVFSLEIAVHIEFQHCSLHDPCHHTSSTRIALLPLASAVALSSALPLSVSSCQRTHGNVETGWSPRISSTRFGSENSKIFKVVRPTRMGRETEIERSVHVIGDTLSLESVPTYSNERLQKCRIKCTVHQPRLGRNSKRNSIYLNFVDSENDPAQH